MRRTPWIVAAAALAASAYAAGPAARTAITIFTAAPDPATAPNAFGGASYGDTITPPTGALITERRELDVGDGGEVRLTGVPDTIDPASVQLRGIAEPLVVTEQRFVPGATTADDVLQRHVGEAITVTTAKGDVTGTLRAADATALVVETAGALRVLRRDGFVLDVKLAGATPSQPQLVWRLGGKHAAKEPVEVTYRAEGMSWSADYIAVFDPSAKTVDFSAWATIKNATTASFDAADVTLVNPSLGSLVSAPSTTPVPVVRARGLAPLRYTVPGSVRIGAGETVQVELMPARLAAKVRPVVTFEAMPDPSANFQQFQAVDCNQLSAQVAGAGHAEVALELDTPGQLPDGKVRLYQRAGSRLDVLSEDQLHTGPGIARIRLASDNDIVGERHATSCTYDEHARTIHEKIELSLENRGKQRTTVIAREFMWRWPLWHLEGDEKPKGVQAGPQTQEYRVDLAPGAKQLVTYTVDYAW